jgi:hypothetical protein
MVRFRVRSAFCAAICPSVFGRNLQCKLVREMNSERNAIGYTHLRFKRTCVGSNGILECKFLSENAHRTPVESRSGWGPDTTPCSVV